MAELLIKPVCSKCGEDARPGAQFCFACGGAIIEPQLQEQDEEVSSAWFKGDIIEASAVPKPSGDLGGFAASPVEVAAGEGAGKVEPEQSSKSNQVRAKTVVESSNSDSKLTSAADLRKRPKPTGRRHVVVSWDSGNQPSGWGFILTGAILTIVCVVLFFLAFYFK
ncbi:MAG: zinc ribbon domain-containing protein [Pyrinomonadaceae bacterium]